MKIEIATRFPMNGWVIATELEDGGAKIKIG
jgi:hypothetical protein